MYLINYPIFYYKINYQLLITTSVIVGPTININEYVTTKSGISTFILKSVVMYEQLSATVVPTTIMGHKTLIFNKSTTSDIYIYCPIMHTGTDITYLKNEYDSEYDSEYSTTGTIFVYIKVGDNIQSGDSAMSPASVHNNSKHSLFYTFRSLTNNYEILFENNNIFTLNKLVEQFIILILLQNERINVRLYKIFAALMLKIYLEADISDEKDNYTNLLKIGSELHQDQFELTPERAAAAAARSAAFTNALTAVLGTAVISAFVNATARSTARAFVNAFATHAAAAEAARVANAERHDEPAIDKNLPDFLTDSELYKMIIQIFNKPGEFEKAIKSSPVFKHIIKELENQNFKDILQKLR